MSRVRLLCEVGGERCDAHRDGSAGPDDKCPYYCDAPGCLAQATGDEYCTAHEALVEGGASPTELVLASRKADRYGVSLERLLVEALRMLPLDPNA